MVRIDSIDPSPGSNGVTPAPEAPLADRLRDPAYQAFLILRTAFVAAPILFGVDKFFNWMTYWPKYLWIGIPHWLGVSPEQFMNAVGVVEILAGVLVLLLPRLAPYVAAATARRIDEGGPSFSHPERFLSLHHHTREVTERQSVDA